MAYDKVIDSSALDANLTSVANAIRSKAGTSGNLAFPTGFVDAISAISAGAVTTEIHDITISSDLTGKSEYRPTIFNGSELAKKYYANDGFFILLFPANGTVTAGAYNIGGIAHMNKPFLVVGSGKYYAVALMYNSAGSAVANATSVYKISTAQPYNQGLMANSSGNISICLPANRNLAAGTYRIVLGIAQ